jgi:hypothetical protein
MKKILQLAVLIMACSVSLYAQQKQSLTASATSCTVSNTACLVYGIDQTMGGATFTVGSNSGGNTLQFEASGDGGSTWVALNVTPSNSTTAVTSTTSTGTWQANVAGYTVVRIRCSTFVSGSAVVSIITSIASARSGGGGGGGTQQQVVPGIVTSGLMAQYQILPTETVASLVDYSGNSRNATGTAGTSPTIIANTGGIQCNGNGGVVLPSSLNSALTIQIEIGYQPGALSASWQSPVIGNGTPATSGVGIVIEQGNIGSPTQYSTLSNSLGSFVNNFAAGGQLYDIEASYIAGTQDVAIILGAASNVMYNNGQLSKSQQTAGGSGKMISGSFQLCGAAAGVGASTQTYFTGQVYYALFYSTALNAQQIYQNHVSMLEALAQRGLTPVNPYRTDNSGVLAVYGDSTTAGSGFTAWTGRVVALNNTLNLVNRGISGFNSAQMLTFAPQTMDSICSTAGGSSGVLYLTGANDTVGTTVYGNLRGFSAQRQFPFCATPNVLISTMMDLGTGSSDAYKNATNLLIRTNCQTFASYCIDLGGTTALGADGAANGTACFQSDHLHPLDVCVINVMTWVYQRGINRFYGNHDFTTARTVTSADTAAVAVTAATESTNTMTFTTAANTFNAGDCVVVAGVTPAGYNSTTANGASLGCWYVLTAPNNTTFTAFNANTGIGALSVAGTAFDPSQKDTDQYIILNYGAGNFTLQPCDGLTINDKTYIMNINAASSTILASNSETITGSATLAQNATAIFQPKLVSPSAGGCNWLRIQ